MLGPVPVDSPRNGGSMSSLLTWGSHVRKQASRLVTGQFDLSSLKSMPGRIANYPLRTKLSDLTKDLPKGTVPTLCLLLSFKVLMVSIAGIQRSVPNHSLKNLFEKHQNQGMEFFSAKFFICLLIVSLACLIASVASIASVVSLRRAIVGPNQATLFSV